jgi:catechol 2,3-dioxygenase-like lactoylglutathione lyase family enzyme
VATAGKDVLVAWEFLVPNLPVRDVQAAQRWYEDVLGLGVNWLWQNNFGSVGSDHVELFLYESDAPHPTTCSIFVDDVDSVYERSRERGGEIVGELEAKPWGVREFSLRDPDGHVFRIGRSESDVADTSHFSVPERGAV